MAEHCFRGACNYSRPGGVQGGSRGYSRVCTGGASSETRLAPCSSQPTELLGLAGGASNKDGILTAQLAELKRVMAAPSPLPRVTTPPAPTPAPAQDNLTPFDNFMRSLNSTHGIAANKALADFELGVGDPAFNGTLALGAPRAGNP